MYFCNLLRYRERPARDGMSKKVKRVSHEYKFKFRSMNKNLMLACLTAQARCLR